MLDLEQPQILRKPSAKLSYEEVELAEKYLQGALHSYTKSHPGQGFALRDLVGGENGDWNGTPLQKFYDYHRESGKNHTQAKEQAAKDVGWVLKAVLAAEEKVYEQYQGGRTKLYRRIDDI